MGPKKDVYNLGYNPQFSLRVTVPDKKPAAVWLLLSKHVMITEENTDYITLHVYSNTNGQRIYYPGDPFKEVIYVCLALRDWALIECLLGNICQ